MKLLLLGPNGQVGWELRRSLSTFGTVIAAGRTGTPAPADLEQVDALRDMVCRERPDVIVNAAAYTAVDDAQKDATRARAVNAVAPGVLAEAAASIGCWLLHYSTDYVFNGSGDLPWLEDDATAPLNVYGGTKLEGEHLIRRSGCRHLIFRTSWVYASRGRNFLRTILRLASERDELKVVNDQYGAPTAADLIADVSAQALRAAIDDPSIGGTYHVAARGVTTWHEYARVAVRMAHDAGWPLKLAEGGIVPCNTADFPTPATRPSNSRLSTAKLRQRLGVELPDWPDGVWRAIQELRGK